MADYECELSYDSSSGPIATLRNHAKPTSAIGSYNSDIHPNLLRHVMRKGGSMAAFSAAAKIGKGTPWAWLNKHDDFAAAFDEGLALAESYWENVGNDIMRGALEGQNSSTAQVYIHTMRFRYWSTPIRSEDRKVAGRYFGSHSASITEDEKKPLDDDGLEFLRKGILLLDDKSEIDPSSGEIE